MNAAAAASCEIEHAAPKVRPGRSGARAVLRQGNPSASPICSDRALLSRRGEEARLFRRRYGSEAVPILTSYELYAYFTQ